MTIQSESGEAIADRLRALVGADQVDTDPDELRRASVDRFKKYQAVHGIYDGPFPAAVVYATSTEQVAVVLAYADAEGLNVVPRTGRTGTEGGLETTVPDSIVLDGSRMAAILAVDEEDMQATVQCGVPLQVLEDRLRERGLTTGHSPQSKPLAQLGGLVATRSIGQLSTLYGGIEDLVVGLEAVLPDGTVTRIKSVPRRAAGPDLRHLVIGNEGALCFVTEVTVKVFRHRPEHQRFHGYLVDDVRTGVAVLREVVAEGYRPSVCRLYSPDDARQHFGDLSQGRWLLVFVTEGPQRLSEATSAGIEDAVAAHEHTVVDPAAVRRWFEGLNWGQAEIDAERASMLATRQLGYTTEVSASWSQVVELYESVVRRVREEYPFAHDLTLLGAHSSHSYQTGTNLYFVYDYRIDCEPREEIEKYHRPLNAIIVEEALRVGGSMVHHHGIGKYRAAWTAEEHGSAYPLLTRVKAALDPRGTMNRGTIFPRTMTGPVNGVGTGLLVGIDVGSQSAKVVVHAADGTVVARGRAPLRPPLTPAPGVVEHPGDDLWDALAAACRRATAELGPDDAGRVVGVGLCGVRFCRALLRADGSLAAPVMSWMDDRVSRPHEQTDDAVAWVSAASGHLTQRLTGRFRDSVASYQGQWPVDTRGWGWLADHADLAAYGVARERLMELVMPGEVLGEVTPAAAAATGLPAGVPVVATGNDKAVEALGGGLRSPADLLVSLGTYVAATSVGDRYREPTAARWTNFSAVPGEYLHESAGVRRGMWTVTWLRELVSGAGLAPDAATLSDGEAGRLLEAGARAVPPGSDGLLALLDWLAPAEAPWRRGAFVGLDDRHGPFHLHRAVLEGLALTVRGHAEAMGAELGTSPRRVVLTGGGSRSEVMTQVVADVFDLPVSRGRAPSAAALGAATAAAVATGVHPSFDAAVAAMVHEDRPVEPTAAGRATYAGLRGVHADLAAALEPVLRRAPR